MWVLRILMFVSLCFANALQEAVEREAQKAFGDLVKIQKVKAFSPIERIDRVELDMEYGRTRALAYVYSGGERHQVLIDALWKVRLFIAQQDIPKGTPIKPEFFRVEERYIKSVPSDLKLREEEFENYVASTHITRGTVLRRSLLKEVPLVQAGDEVEVVYKGDGIELRFHGQALDTGGRGKRVRVKRDGKIIRGKVVGKGLVEVMP